MELLVEREPADARVADIVFGWQGIEFYFEWAACTFAYDRSLPCHF